MTSPAAAPRTNALLSALPLAHSARLSRLLKLVPLTFGDVLYDTKQIPHVYFPIDCLVSLLAPLKDHMIEVGIVGSEGMVGVPLALGVRASSVHAFVQGSGTALRMQASAFERELARNPALRASIHRYIHVLMGQLTQTAACNAIHPIEARCARWMLMTRDRTHAGALELTHAFLARMLGVRRVGVTVAAGNLQRRGLISYSRGRVTILDAKRLEATACECYRIVKDLDDSN